MPTIINRLIVTGEPREFERLLGRITEYMSSQPGFIDHQLYRSIRRPDVYIELARWKDAESHQRAIASEGFKERVREISAVATAEPDIFEPLS